MSKNQDKYGFDLIKSKKSKSGAKKQKNINSEKSLIFSKKIIAALEEKVKEYNKNNEKQITLSNLKKAYKSGFNNAIDLNLETLAYVNLYIRVSEGKATNLITNFKLNLLEIIGNTVEVKGSLSPEQIDYEKAQEDIKKYNLEDFDFKNADELYLDDEEDRITLYGV